MGLKMSVYYETQSGEEPTPKVYRKNGKGKKVKSKGRAFICNRNALINIIVYETTARSVENPNPTREEERLRAAFFSTNMTNKIHPFFTDFGKPNYVQLHEEWATEIADNIIAEWEKHASPKDKENIKISSKLKGETLADREQMSKAFYMYDYGISLAHDECEALAIHQQQKLISDMDFRFYQRFTNNKEFNHAVTSAFHPKFEGGQWQSHVHSKLLQFDFNGKKLNLDNNFLRMQIIGCETENDPHFSKYLGKTITNALERKHSPKTLEEFDLFQNLIIDNISDDLKNPRSIKKNLVDKKIKIFPIHKGNELKDAFIEYQGRKIKVSSLMNKKCKTLIDRYLKLGDLEISTKIDSTKLVEDTQNLVKYMKSKSKKEFITELESNGILLLPSVRKNGTIQGYSLYFKDIQKKMTISSLGMSKKDFPFTEENDIEFLRKLSRRNNALAGLSKRKEPEPTGEISLTGIFDKRFKSYKKRKRMFDYESIDEYMADSGGQYDITLKKFSYADGKFYRGEKEKLAINHRNENSMNITVKGDDMQTARAAIQLFLENGFNTVTLENPSNDKMACNLWRAAMEMGVKFSGYRPNPADEKWLRDLQDKKLADKREQNRLKMLECHQNGSVFRISHVSNQWHQIDTRTTAYAFIDAIQAGIDPISLLTTANGSKDPVTKTVKPLVSIEDLQNQAELIMEISMKECPDRSGNIAKCLANLNKSSNRKIKIET